ncbi:hypothetical protein OCV99_03785 [Dorea acetigenes]|uniref:Prealbumin-like fold domain-containing protein n=1 Tax=Dorea acetigenes TaxID=2981787 RepID=A0ABT2RJW3_9FIRM|nr:hypothetical protein [Dorea acetigenes]MCU6685687.1 hypothetical protein [Dorea acetigenes]SCI59573.1 Uncharacterised protein [uncultured Clostridium sp.]
MVIKMQVIRDKDGNPDKKKVFATNKSGSYQTLVTLTPELLSELAKGHYYFNAMQKEDGLHITGIAAGKF